MNAFYINIAKNIRIEKAEQVNKEHPSIKKISKNIDVESFIFWPVTEKQVSKCIKNLIQKRATGVDALLPKVVKAAMPSLSQPICNIANAIICKKDLPWHVTPSFKKDDPFIPKKYRPVSILPTHSKIYERLISDQLSEHFNKTFHNFLSAFRPAYGCKTTLLHVVEDWQEAL